MNQNQPPALQQQQQEEKKEEEKGGMFSFLGFGGRRRTKRLNKSKSKSKKRLNKSNKRLKKRSKKSKMNKKYNTDLIITALIYFPLQQLKTSCEINHSYNGIITGKTNFKHKKQESIFHLR